MKTQNHPPTSDANAADVDRERIEYECPHCGARYDNETLARIHITRSDDEAHGDRDGLVPGETISIVDDDGSDLGTSEIDAEQQDVQELSVDDIPDDYKQQHQQIILVGAQNPYEPSYTALEGEVRETLTEQGFDTPSYSTIRRVIREFFRPQEGTTSEEASDEMASEELLGDLTTKQQSIVIAHVANPEEDNSEIADRVGAARSYPGKVYSRAQSVVERLQSKIESGEQVEHVILQEMSETDLQGLYDDEYVNKLGVDLLGVLAENGDEVDIDTDAESFDLPVSQQRNPMRASPYESDERESETDADSPNTSRDRASAGSTADSGSVVEQNASAEPSNAGEQQPAADESTHPEGTDVVESGGDEAETPAEASESTDHKSSEETDGESKTAAEREVASGAGHADGVQAEPTGTEDTVPRAEVERLRAQLKFTREVAADSVEHLDGRTADQKMISLARRVENQLDEILAE